MLIKSRFLDNCILVFIVLSTYNPTLGVLCAGRSAGRDSGGVPVMVDGAGELSGGCGKPPDLALLRTVQYSHWGRVFPVREGQGRMVTASSGNTHWRFWEKTIEIHSLALRSDFAMPPILLWAVRFQLWVHCWLQQRLWAVRLRCWQLGDSVQNHDKNWRNTFAVPAFLFAYMYLTKAKFVRFAGKVSYWHWQSWYHSVLIPNHGWWIKFAVFQ